MSNLLMKMAKISLMLLIMIISVQTWQQAEAGCFSCCFRRKLPVSPGVFDIIYQSNRFVGSVCQDQGGRHAMEDFYAIGRERFFCSFFDGHGGTFAAQTAAQSVSHYINRLSVINEESLQSVFKQIDGELLRAPGRYDYCGSTAIAIVPHRNNVFLVNIGDSRIVVGFDDGSFYATKDHKPGNVEEQDRIESCGGFVRDNGRMYGLNTYYNQFFSLATSRALGDYFFKRYGCSSQADITVLDIGTVSFALLASDGLWDVMSSQDVATFVQDRLSGHFTTRADRVHAKTVINQITQDLVAYASEQWAVKFPRCPMDNITVILMHLLPIR